MRQVPVTGIHEIELSSRCNLACKYCPHPKLERAKADMPWPVFQRALDHVEFYCRQGTQGELSLTGIGEAILHPYFFEALIMARSAIGRHRPLTLATNGVAMTPEIARILRQTGVQVYVSTHRPEKAGPALEMLKKEGAAVGTNMAFVDNAFDWAGQVKWHASAERRPCEYLTQGWGVIRQDGSVTTCCLDAHAKHAIGHVDDEPGSLKTHITTLCSGCHMVPPAFMTETADDQAAA